MWDVSAGVLVLRPIVVGVIVESAAAPIELVGECTTISAAKSGGSRKRVITAWPERGTAGEMLSG
jgi:hypothetical protein